MIFPLFVIMTLLEIYVLASVGSSIGGFATVLLVIITALVGSILLKQQGWSTLSRAQQTASSGQVPTFEVFEGVVILISAILLLTPGFITDTFGLLGLIPFFRKYFIAYLLEKNARRIFSHTTIFKQKKSVAQSQQKNENTIEGEFWEE